MSIPANSTGQALSATFNVLSSSDELGNACRWAEAILAERIWGSPPSLKSSFQATHPTLFSSSHSQQLFP
ncbi:hypothetical protein M378DRAFT_14357 [Amanita muscaria Koide BX008]|uniref:Uncharacterized protein n=1 Tax=Amanita muscaria (strain Koide BX008) TaxID=946122 RepID=A0A0C2T0Y2_AMAMK|nr:hypothetical protein M378DRAFT_14357 [Amanita muscaria Koide BX008]